MKKRTTKEFIEICNLVHNKKYDYSNTEYTSKDVKIKIICPIHGEFEQIANDHIRGAGCKKCSFNGINKKGADEFIEEANKIHNNKYDYSKVEYINTKTKVKIICPSHGEFEQIPKNHLKKSGCPKCASIFVGNMNRKNSKIFINEAKLLHGDKYDYSKVEYINAKTKIKIICPIHGEFEQMPDAHTKLKQGCPNCHYDKVKYNAPSWTKENWVNAGKNSTNFDGFKLYVIECSNENEIFYKIGRTYTKLYRRFSQIPYNVKLIKLIESENGEYIFDLEQRVKRFYKKFKYHPNINFGGKYECFKP
jgi:hypothetical protein